MFVTKRIGLARAVGFLLLQFPSALAFATPSCCRPGIDHARIQPRPPAWSHREHDQAHATVVHNPQQVGGASGEPVGLAGYQGIATADEAWGFLEPVTMGCGGNLLREDFLAPSTGQDRLPQATILVVSRSLPHHAEAHSKHRALERTAYDPLRTFATAGGSWARVDVPMTATMIDLIAVLGLLVTTPRRQAMTDPQHSLTAIDIALEPDAVMMSRAFADIAALRETSLRALRWTPLIMRTSRCYNALYGQPIFRATTRRPKRCWRRKNTPTGN